MPALGLALGLPFGVVAEAGFVPGGTGPTLSGWGEGGDASDLGEYYVAAVNLDWTEVANATEYRIYRNEDGGSFSLLDTVSELTYRDDTVDWGSSVNYDYYVVASDGANDSQDSNTLEFTPLPLPSPTYGFLLNSGNTLGLNATGKFLLN